MGYQILHWHPRIFQSTRVIKKCLMRCQQGGCSTSLKINENFKCIESSNTGSSFSLIFILCKIYSIYFGNILRKQFDEQVLVAFQVIQRRSLVGSAGLQGRVLQPSSPPEFITNYKWISYLNSLLFHKSPWRTMGTLLPVFSVQTRLQKPGPEECYEDKQNKNYNASVK